MNDREWLEHIQFDSRGLVPVIAQEQDTHEVLMLAYANREALTLTLETRLAHYFSRSREKIWQKGETSGHIQHVEGIFFDCDQDAVLYSVRQEGPACHTGQRSCFYRAAGGVTAASGVTAVGSLASVDEESNRSLGALETLQATVTDRREHPKAGSYTNYLFDKGIDKILKKVGEENAEVIIAAKNNDPVELRSETADLLYHLSVMLTERGVSWSDVFAELQARIRVN